ncbi:MAG TPA: hypothetical protein VGG38_07920 [Acidimicrobiales bacterium]|jgi:hypothetical protein
MGSPYEELKKSLTIVIRADRELKTAEVMLRRQVKVARRDGHSWSAIGYALVVSIQAAQQRFSAGAFSSPLSISVRLLSL